MALNTKILEMIQFSVDRVGKIGNPVINGNVARDLVFDNGTATQGQADQIFTDTRTLAASATENLDLIGGGLLMPLGEVFGPTEIVAMFISAASTNVNSVVVGAAATNPFTGPLGATGTVTIKPGEHVLLASKSGWPVVATTADLLKIANGGAGSSVEYSIVLIGRTVAQ